MEEEEVGEEVEVEEEVVGVASEGVGVVLEDEAVVLEDEAVASDVVVGVAVVGALDGEEVVSRATVTTSNNSMRVFC